MYLKSKKKMKKQFNTKACRTQNQNAIGSYFPSNRSITRRTLFSAKRWRGYAKFVNWIMFVNIRSTGCSRWWFEQISWPINSIKQATPLHSKLWMWILQKFGIAELKRFKQWFRRTHNIKWTACASSINIINSLRCAKFEFIRIDAFAVVQQHWKGPKSQENEEDTATAKMHFTSANELCVFERNVWPADTKSAKIISMLPLSNASISNQTKSKSAINCKAIDHDRWSF